MHVEITNEDGRLLGIVGLDVDGHAALLEGSDFDPETFFDRKLFVSPEWAQANGAGDLPVVAGAVLISPLDGEPYLRALAFFTRTGYLNGRLVDDSAPVA